VQVVAVTGVHPVKLAKLEPASGVAVSVTVVPAGKLAEHVAVQLMPPTSLVIVPAPVPVFLTVSVKLAKTTVTVRACVIVTVHVVAVTLAQPVNVTPRLAFAGAAVSTTVSPAAKLAAPIDGQAISFPAVVTEPEPDRDTVSLNFENVAVTVFAALMVTLHSVPFVEVQPFQPPNPEPASGVAVRVTGVSGGKSWKQT